MIELSVIFKLQNTEMQEFITAKLYNIGFEGFWFEQNTIKAYIDESNFDKHVLDSILQNEKLHIQYFTKKLEEKNWNEQWEKSFEPIVIKEKLLIKAPFHTNLPVYPLQIIIQPQMSFGTGHHPTTQLITSYMLNKDFKNKKVIDAGCGTGILSILAEKLGADKVFAFDIDENAYKNAKENIKLNNCFKVEVLHGTIKSVSIENADVLIANINRNILLDELFYYSEKLVSKGNLIISGFLEQDVAILKQKAETCALALEEIINLNDWYALIFTK